MYFQPLVSIIIPVYNVEKYLRQCLESIVNQTYTNIEIIIINDGTKDDSGIIISEFESFDKRIKIVNQENQGLSGARNTGILNATGTYLMFVDSDDWLNLNTIKYCIDQLNINQVDVILFSYVKEYDHSSENKFILEKNQLFKETDCQYLHQRIIGLNGKDLTNPEHADSLVTAWGKLYKSEIIKSNNIQFIDCKIVGPEDIMFSVESFYYVKSAFYLHECLYHYRKTNISSITTAYRPKIIFQFPILYNYLEDFLNQKKLHGNYEQAFNNRISMSIVGLGLNEMSSNKSFFEKYKNLKSIISTTRYSKSIAKFQTAYLPIYWKLFYFFCKNKITIGVYGLLFCIHFLLNRKSLS